MAWEKQGVFIIINMQNTEKKQFSTHGWESTTHALLSSQNSLQCKKVNKKLLQVFCSSFPFSKISNKICRKEPKTPETTLNVTQMTEILYFITSKQLREIGY